MLMLLPAQQVLFVDVLDVVLDVDIDDVVVGVGDIDVDIGVNVDVVTGPTRCRGSPLC